MQVFSCVAFKDYIHGSDLEIQLGVVDAERTCDLRGGNIYQEGTLKESTEEGCWGSSRRNKLGLLPPPPLLPQD